MKKIRIVIIAVLLVGIAVFSSILMASGEPSPTQKEKVTKFGDITKKHLASKDNKVAFTINGLEVTVDQVNKRKELEQSLGNLDITDSENVKAIAVKILLLDKAKKQGIKISDEEARKASLEEKEIINSGNIGKENLEAFLAYKEALGLSEDEYWNDFHAQELKEYLTINALYEKFTKDAINDQKILVQNVKPAELTKAKKKYFEDYKKNLYNNAKIEFNDSKLKAEVESGN
ncbi:hypothetical protein [Ruminiclostridium cellulolyticum]|uniref:SurA domain protein n=1 Tax=Ruminiclostridium cellulolyticum (strain ATCC 35319 / DSM 5812 / JCM 6584 / H10) TaxID=394503 RepID=B8I609_RUMCH|nr:hypothetical protein [Ruminiclostridium cellulolyticum]ACL76774.1 hypothetical protein Ccel_2445 [Ruminiclostridium cellulolyticum H10]